MNMQALILAGGRGTRLRPLTLYTPKPIVPLANRPFLLYQIEILAKAGISDITLSLGYQPDKIEEILGDGSDFGVRVKFVTEPQPLGTAGAYRFAADSSSGTTVVLNGDILTDLDIAGLIKSHKDAAAAATIVLTNVDDPTSYGLVEADATGRVMRFIEKPSVEQLQHLSVRTINAGIYVLEPTVLDLIAEGENSSFEYDVFPKILEEKRAFAAYVLDGDYWRDIGTPASYLAAHNDLLAESIRGFNVRTEAESDVATAASIDRRSLIGAGCVIKPGARVINSVLGPGVHLDERASVENSVLWSHSRIAAGAEINGAILGRGCHIGRSTFVGAGSVLGDKTVLPDYSRV